MQNIKDISAVLLNFSVEIEKQLKNIPTFLSVNLIDYCFQFIHEEE